MKHLKIVSWNVNGIRAVLKKGALQQLIEGENPDILCLQETKAQRHQVPVDFAEYKEYWNSATRAGYSGTAIFSKQEPLAVYTNIPQDIAQTYQLRDEYGNTNDEGRVITAEYESFFLTTVYTPNAKDDLSRIPMRHKQWDPAFLAYMKRLEEEKPVIFCGDLNVAHTPDDLARPKQNEGVKGFTKEEREGFDAIVQAGFIDTFRLFHQGNGHYTWWSHWGNARANNVGWRIDYVVVSHALKNHVKTAAIHPVVTGSDHCPVSITLKI